MKMSEDFRVLQVRSKDIGSFSVRRAIPQMAQRHVGPFVFFDHMGPVTLPPGQGMDVRPHPHVGLATITYLFDGSLVHRDSLGTTVEIVPGDVNWMASGRGIVHSERSSDAVARSRSANARPANLGRATVRSRRHGPRILASRTRLKFPSFLSPKSDARRHRGHGLSGRPRRFPCSRRLSTCTRRSKSGANLLVDDDA